MNEATGRAMPVHWMVPAIAVVAAVAGLYGRFKGIGTWPLGADEFYLSRSVDYVLRSGLPAFPCGGYYNRGLTLQYAIAALRLIGLSPEFAGRFVAATAGLAIFPAVYLLAKRLQGTLAAWLVVTMLCLSVWEIEMARFARMYAPFQAVFCWYAVAYLRFTIDRDARALKWMAALSIVGVLTWEGGILLGLANLCAVLQGREGGRFERRDGWRLLAFGLLLVLFYFLTRDLRGFAAPPPGHIDTDDDPVAPWRLAASWAGPLGGRPLWLWTLALPLGAAVAARRWLLSVKGGWVPVVGLATVLACGVAHEFLLGGGLLLVMLLLGVVDPSELTWRRASAFWLALGASLVFWIVVGSFGSGMLQWLCGFPAVYDKVLRPWGRTVPVLSVELFVALGYWGWSFLVGGRYREDPVAGLLGLVILLVLAVGAIPTDRVETRYTFFLYPSLLVLATCAVLRVSSRITLVRSAPAILAAVPLACFAASGDFRPLHLARVDSAEINFRTGMSPALADHYYPKNDLRSAAVWLQSHVGPGDHVITGVPSLDEYYRHIDYFYLDEADDRYDTYVCPDGRTERWTNRPVLYTEEALKPLLAGGHRVYASLYSSAERRLRDFAVRAGWTVTRVWASPYGGSDIIQLDAAPPAPGR